MAKILYLNNFECQFIDAVKDVPTTGTPATELNYGILRLNNTASGVLVNPTGGDYYLLTAFKRSGGAESTIEVMKVTEVDITTYPGECRIKVARAQEGTSAKAYVTGDYVQLRLTKGGAETFQQAGDKDISDGFPGLTLFKLNLRNAANTVTSWFTTAATAARTWTMPDKDGTVAMTSDVHDATGKTTPVDNDEIGLVDSAASNVLKKLTWANLKTTLLTWLRGTVFPSPGAIGGTTPAAGSFTTLGASGAVTFLGNLSVGSLNGSSPGGIRSLIYNGDMRVAQRGSSFSFNGTPTFGSIDGYQVYQPGAGANAGTFSQVAGSGGFQYFAKLQRSPGSTLVDSLVVQRALETANCILNQGKQVTVSCYVKAGTNYSGGSTFTIAVISGTGTDQPSTGINGGSWTGWINHGGASTTPTGTLTRISGTITVPSNATQLGLFIAYTPTGTAGADDSVSFTCVRIEPGTVPTPSENLPIGVELELCRRYYEVIGDGVTRTRVAAGAMYTNSLFHAILCYKTTKRTSPTVSIKTGAATDFRVLLGGGAIAVYVLSAGEINVNCCFLTATTSAGIMGYGGSFESNDGVYPTIQISAEL